MLSLKEKLLAAWVGMVIALVGSGIHLVLGAAMLYAMSVISHQNYVAMTDISLFSMALGVVLMYLWLCYKGIAMIVKLFK